MASIQIRGAITDMTVSIQILEEYTRSKYKGVGGKAGQGGRGGSSSDFANFSVYQLPYFIESHCSFLTKIFLTPAPYPSATDSFSPSIHPLLPSMNQSTIVCCLTIAMYSSSNYTFALLF